MARDDVLIRALPLGDQWSVYGVDQGRGVTIEGLVLGVDDWGPHDLAGTLQRDPSIAFGDLQAATPLEVEIGGSKLWAGRISETPTSEENRQIAIQGEGWQYHLDDDDYQKTYVQSSLAAWGDIRSNVNCDLTKKVGAITISSDAGGISLTLPQGQVRPSGTGGGIYLDMGPTNVAKRVVVSWSHSNNESTTTLILCEASTVAALSTAAASFNIVTLNATPTGTTGFTLTGSRYIGLFLIDNTGVTFTAGADVWCKLPSIQVFTSLTYESGNVSVLTASTVIADALTRCPLLSSDHSLIASTAFDIPDLVMMSYQTSRSVVTAVNAYHAYQARVRADMRFEFRPRPTAPLLTLANGTFDDTSAGSLDQVYNRCYGNATGPDGVQIVSVQNGNGTTIPDRRGYVKANVLDTNMSLTQAALDQICQTFVSGHTRTPFKGTLTVQGYDGVGMTVGGAHVPAWELLQYVGEMIHFPNMVDPDTGAKGRDGRISAVQYTHDTRTSSVSIDSTRSNFEALLARLQVVTGTVG